MFRRQLLILGLFTVKVLVLLPALSEASCRHPLLPSTATLVSATASIYRANSTVHYSCATDEGAVMRDASCVYGKAGISANGFSWQPPPSCELASCDFGSLPMTNGLTLMVHKTGRFATFSCEHGFKLNGDPHIDCTWDGRLVYRSGDRPSCTEAFRCELHSLSRSFRYYSFFSKHTRHGSTTSKSSVGPGETVYFTCLNRQDRQLKSVCTEDGFQPPVTDLNCEPDPCSTPYIKLEDDTWQRFGEFADQRYAENQSIYFGNMCKQTYASYWGYAYCTYFPTTSHFAWNPPPYCKPLHFECNINDLYIPNSEEPLPITTENQQSAFVECRYGYASNLARHSAVFYVKCDHQKGTWNPQLFCVWNVTCNYTKLKEHDENIVATAHDEDVELSCKAGFHLESTSGLYPEDARCLPTGELQFDKTIYCQPITCVVHSDQFWSVHVNDSREEVQYGDAVLSTCKNRQDRQLTSVCDESGYLHPSPSSLDCPEPCNLQGEVHYQGGFYHGLDWLHGGMQPGFAENENASYRCELGYTALSAVVVCKYNHTLQKFLWEPQPICRHDSLFIPDEQLTIQKTLTGRHAAVAPATLDREVRRGTNCTKVIRVKRLGIRKKVVVCAGIQNRKEQKAQPACTVLCPRMPSHCQQSLCLLRLDFSRQTQHASGVIVQLMRLTAGRSVRFWNVSADDSQLPFLSKAFLGEIYSEGTKALALPQGQLLVEVQYKSDVTIMKTALQLRPLQP